jgi:hypothetical protein
MLAEKLTHALTAIDVAQEPRRVAQGATLLEQVQAHEQREAQLSAQVEEFLAGRSETVPVDQKPLADWAEEVLLDSRGPMRYREIAAEIRSRGFRHAREPKWPNQLADSVWSAMYEDSKKRFVKVGRGIWDLSARASSNGT